MSKQVGCGCTAKGRKHLEEHGCKLQIVHKLRDMIDANEKIHGIQGKAANVMNILEILFFRQCGRSLFYTEPKFRAVVMMKLEEFKSRSDVGHIFEHFDLLAKQIIVALDAENKNTPNSKQ
uniref:Uncharacterized protein n=1 Tax=Clandestinovirus TaxID=2831644 RepID=A0A8F8KP50_9VIRU|nr:hypothetical protein KOM_12_227 [Clandestinovirus]